jgi:hypothetical protein
MKRLKFFPNVVYGSIARRGRKGHLSNLPLYYLISEIFDFLINAVRLIKNKRYAFVFYFGEMISVGCVNLPATGKHEGG